MNILIPDSWLREFLDTDASPPEIARFLSLCGPSVERLDKVESDYLYDIELTSNRVDSMSIMGIAREAAAILPQFGKKARLRKTADHQLSTRNANGFPLNITVKNQLCARVMAVVIKNATIKPSPARIKKRLRMVGINHINSAVDTTNYVLAELGHPTHVFDFDLVKSGSFIIRRGRAGEEFIDLHGTHHTLHGGETVIDNGSGLIIDLPGIIGAKNSAVHEDTKNMLLFLEVNDPVQIRTASMNLGIRTHAAVLNEKGIDPELSPTALARGMRLLQAFTNGHAAEVFDYYPKPYKPRTVTLTKQKAFTYLGTHISDSSITRMLDSLGFDTKTTKHAIHATVPSFRNLDIATAEDLIEELARIYGYHNIAATLPTGTIPTPPRDPAIQWEYRTKLLLKNWGYTETYTYSFVSQSMARAGGYALKDHLTLANPLTEDMVYLRRSLLPSLLTVVSDNQARVSELELFEIAATYHPQPRKKLPLERVTLAIIDQRSFTGLKGTIEALCNELGIDDISFAEDVHPLMHEYQTASIFHKSTTLGAIGTLRPDSARQAHIDNETYVAELDLTALFAKATTTKQFTPLPKHPAVIEDFSFVLPNQTAIGPVLAAIRKISTLIRTVEVVDTYQDTTTLRIAFQHTHKNLSKTDVEKLRRKLVQRVGRHGGTLKKY